MSEKITIGNFEIEKYDVDYFTVYHDILNIKLKICGGDLETILQTVFVDAERMTINPTPIKDDDLF